MRVTSIIAALLCVGFVLALGGCTLPTPQAKVQPEVLHSWVEVHEQKHGEFTSQVPLGESVEVAATFSWGEKGSAGVHHYRSELYKDGKCINRDHGAFYRLNASPFKYRWLLDSRKLGKGRFECRVYQDDKLAKTISFIIVDPKPSE
jgi:hypothetical protein